MEYADLCEIIGNADAALHRCAEFNTHDADQRFSPLRGQGRVLRMLQLSPSVRQRDLAYLLNVSQQALCENLMKLERKGYVERKACENDKRSVMVSLTPAGEMAAAAIPDTSEMQVDPFECLTQEQQQTLRELLTAVIEHLDRRLPERRPPAGRTPFPFPPPMPMSPGEERGMPPMRRGNEPFMGEYPMKPEMHHKF